MGDRKAPASLGHVHLVYLRRCACLSANQLNFSKRMPLNRLLLCGQRMLGRSCHLAEPKFALEPLDPSFAVIANRLHQTTQMLTCEVKFTAYYR
jgi:hypothetical protein